MPQNPKKKKRRKLSSTSSDETEKKILKFEDDSRRRKNPKRKEDVKSHARKVKEEKKLVKKDSNSPRHIKKPIYRLPKTQVKEQKAISKEKHHHHRSTSRVSVHHQDKGCSNTETKDVSSKHKSTSKGKAVEKKHSEPSRTRDAASRATKTLEERTDKYSQGTSFKLKKQQMRPSLSTVVQKDWKQNGQRRKDTAEEPPRTRHDNSTRKTNKPASSCFKDSPKQECREEIPNSCKNHQAKALPAKWSLCTDAKDSSTSVKNKSSSPAKHCTSGSSSSLWKSIPSTGEGDTSVPPKPAQPWSAQKQILSQKLAPFKFRIPRKSQPRTTQSSGANDDSISTNKNLEKTNKNKRPASEVLKKKPELETVHPRGSLGGFYNSSSERQDQKSPSPVQLPPSGVTNLEKCYDQGQVVKELHLARSEKKLEVNVMQSYGDLTCMDIDSPEEGPADRLCKQPRQQDLILVLDTNILLSHLDYVKKIKSCGLGALGFPVVLIPWVVLQELDSLKRGRGQIGSVVHLATPAISYIYSTLKKRDPRLWGQSMQQASVSSNGLNAENNDDRVLQCCLQYQNMYPGCALILCTNDKNLCSKAHLCGVTALCKSDLEAEVKKPGLDHSILQNIQAPVLPQISPEVSSLLSCTTVQPRGQEKDVLFVDVPEKDKQLSEGRHKQDLSRSLSELEECLREVLADVLEVEMKAAYEDLWLEIVYIKPPWALQDILQCFKKHWIAVFGQIVPRKMLEIISNLIIFFSSGEAVHSCETSKALQEAKELVKAFRKSSKHVPQAVTVLENINNKLQSQHNVSVEEGLPACDVIMKDDDEDKPLISARVSHQEVWAVFETIWSNVFQTSLEVFKALGFDPHTMQTATAMGGPGPPQDALACLHKLSSMVSQLLQAFSSVLSSAPVSEEVQMLLTIIYSNKIVNEDSRLTAKDLLDCFSQSDYREKLRVGGNQLMELKKALDCCVQVQHTSFTT